MPPHALGCRTALTVVLLALRATPSLAAQAAPRERTAMAAAIDSIAQAPIAARRVAGMSIAVVKGADTIALRGYGAADLELEVPTPDRAVYEIGSVTKQFTAAAVLLLQERGKLSLDDELAKYLPAYPTKGHRITVRRLLDHTSGIKGYTEIPAFWSTLAMRDRPRDSLVALFSAEPFDFAPGEAMIYNNSAYFLLGLVIEKASGMSYERFVEEEVFKPARMPDSRYCSEREIIPRRARGYEVGDSATGLRRAPFLVHTWPYAAGSLCSTAGDLVAWNRSLHGHGEGGSLLSPASYRELITPGTLNDGARLRYAKGLLVAERRGRRVIAHGGGIYGFVSESRYFPEQDLVIVVLINTAGPVSPSDIGDAIEQVVLGTPAAAPARPFAGDSDALAGTYRGPGRGRELTVTVARDTAGLTLRIGGGRPRRLQWLDGLTFGEADGIAQYHFVRGEGGIDQLRVDQGGGYYVLRRVKG